MNTGATTTAASSSDPPAAGYAPQLPSEPDSSASNNDLAGTQETGSALDRSAVQQSTGNKDQPVDGGSGQSHVELDEFGLPIRVFSKPSRPVNDSLGESEAFSEAADQITGKEKPGNKEEKQTSNEENPSSQQSQPAEQSKPGSEPRKQIHAVDIGTYTQSQESNVSSGPVDSGASGESEKDKETAKDISAGEKTEADKTHPEEQDDKLLDKEQQPQAATAEDASHSDPSQKRHSSAKPSEWSHQGLVLHHDSEEELEEEEEGDWQPMPALGEFDVYDDYGRLVARGAKQEDDEAVYQGLGGAGKGYTRVQLDEDAQSATSMDEDTSYLFKENGHTVGVDEELRDPTTQLQATKDLLTEGQRIAYVGVTRLSIYQMDEELRSIVTTRGSKKALQGASDSIKKWGQMMMARLYAHMDIDTAEQIMIEQLADHGVQPADLVRPLMQNARVKNPMAEELNSPKKSTSMPASPASRDLGASRSTPTDDSFDLSSPPPYEEHKDDELPEVRTPSQLPTSQNIDIDLRWTVLCDLFLVLIADSTYDSRSRRLLERVGEAMDVPWVQICRFEKRVIDALEMQEESANTKETWDEAENMEQRRKKALKKKYMIMGLATVGGGLVIGLSAGLLAPVIGAGLAAGFTTIGISGTGAFLGGAGGTALIASGATLTGSTIGIRASHRRTGAVKTFEYRPLHNNKRVNLIVTVSGWMTGNVDDVRLPFSTVDPIMGDLYSVLWEPEMLRSMGDTINILATEALTQGLQQVLGSTVLVALMASLQLPIVLTKLAYLIDNPWNVSLVRANAAGLILADSLMARNLGNRPVTLIGFSLGARVIFSCLKELANRGAYGLVQNVYLFGSPVVAKKDEYLRARSVISGRFVNGYASNDWILGYLFRATSGGIMQVAGLAPVQGIPGLENIDVTNLVNGHMAYRAAMPRILREVGWEVLDDEFAEIEDPDPENHAERQRELIREIDEARREAEQKPEKRRFGFFKRGKLAEKKAWETYDPDKAETGRRDSVDSSSTRAGSVLFDIDAIRNELAGEQIEVKQLESTLPPMKVELGSSSKPSSPSTVERPATMQHSKSADASLPVPKIPSSPDTKSPHDPYSHPEEEEIQMTFDTSYSGHDHHSSTFSRSQDEFSSPPSSRPGFHSSATMPAAVGIGAGAVVGGALGLGLEENAWAQDDFGHGGDDEIQMTFE
ncbi:hypothetical protein DTO027B5_1897 [Paecilomyces variotii]|nr:hypothetical protein DTO169C6_1007 [Paecilomyces variotii]KAJ9327509.1 hypothetical protein DTO027B3_1731 [Paecilomyces variotii]KAJ9336216.1 hypothetical protein DTO027B5_1897 [Paecilomyces variotii]